VSNGDAEIRHRRPCAPRVLETANFLAPHPRHNYCLAATLYLRGRLAMCSLSDEPAYLLTLALWLGTVSVNPARNDNQLCQPKRRCFDDSKSSPARSRSIAPGPNAIWLVAPAPNEANDLTRIDEAPRLSFGSVRSLPPGTFHRAIVTQMGGPDPLHPISRSSVMQLGMIGLGRMGANIVRRLQRDGQECVVIDRNPAASTSSPARARPAL
jgi:hypothetical protein